jgi:hypothetical protein
MDDNQFRKKTGEDAYATKRSKKVKDDDVIDLYSEFNDPHEGKLDPEVEELKRLAQADALRAYGWVRRWLSYIGKKIDKVEAFRVTTKQKKLAKVAIPVLLLAFIGFKTIPSLYKNLTENNGILGESESAGPDFNTLINPSGSQPGLVFDQEARVASFKDDIGGFEAVISQQQLPVEVKAKQSGVEQLALSLSDKATINRYETNKGQIYVVEAQNTTQTVIFGYENLLIFIRSTGNIDDQLWVDYVNGLQLGT